MAKPAAAEYTRGAHYGLGAVSIWASWILAVRLGIRTSLTPLDLTAIRFAVAGSVLLPYLLKRGLAVDRLGRVGLAAILVGGGAPMVLLSYGGLIFAPAAHAASLYTALIPIFVAILSAVVFGEAFTVAKRIGLVLIVTGVLGIFWRAGGTIGRRQNVGHAMFVGACMMWTCYTVAMRKARLDGLHAAAIAAVGSLAAYVPVYAILFGTRLFDAPWRDVAVQAFVHGFLTAVISLLLYGRAVAIRGDFDRSRERGAHRRVSTTGTDWRQAWIRTHGYGTGPTQFGKKRAARTERPRSTGKRRAIWSRKRMRAAGPRLARTWARPGSRRDGRRRVAAKRRLPPGPGKTPR